MLLNFIVAAATFINAVWKKCNGPANEWPLDPPSFEDFNQFME